MARSYWTIYTKSSGNIWELDGQIARPNENISLPKTSTQSTAQLADGSEAYVAPETKYLDGNIEFTWIEDDGTIKTQIDNYIINQEDIKIVDHNAVAYIGRFISITPTWIAGQEDTYDIQASFKIMPSLDN